MSEDDYLKEIPLSEVAADAPDAFVDGPFGSNLKSAEYTDDGVRLIQLQNIGVGQWLDFSKKFVSKRKLATLARHAVRAGDIAIAKMAEPVARACVVPPVADDFLVVADCIKLRVDEAKADPRFVVDFLNSHDFRTQAERRSIGTTRIRINLSVLKNLRISVPGLAAQHRIAEILDTVEEAIRSTERLIAKLEQAKQGLLRDLLTNGTSAWRMSNVESEFVVKPGITLGPDRAPRSRPSPYLRVANVQRYRIEASDIAFLEASPGETIGYALAVGDLLVVEGHANAWEIGRCAIVTESQAGLLYQNHLFRLRSRNISPEFGLLWLNSAFAQNYWWRMCATSSGLNTINSRQLRALPVPVPNAKEQARIVDLVAGTTSRLSAEQRELDKLRLLKRGLMNDLLTGRVQVGASR